MNWVRLFVCEHTKWVIMMRFSRVIICLWFHLIELSYIQQNLVHYKMNGCFFFFLLLSFGQVNILFHSRDIKYHSNHRLILIQTIHHLLALKTIQPQSMKWAIHHRWPWWNVQRIHQMKCHPHDPYHLSHRTQVKRINHQPKQHLHNQLNEVHFIVINNFNSYSF